MNEHYTLAAKAHEQKNFSEAIAHLQKHLGEQPDDDGAWLWLAQLWCEIRQFREAESAVGRASNEAIGRGQMPDDWSDMPRGPVLDPWDNVVDFSVQELHQTEVAGSLPAGGVLTPHERELLEFMEVDITWCTAAKSKGIDGLEGTPDDLVYWRLMTPKGTVAARFVRDENIYPHR